MSHDHEKPRQLLTEKKKNQLHNESYKSLMYCMLFLFLTTLFTIFYMIKYLGFSARVNTNPFTETTDPSSTTFVVIFGSMFLMMFVIFISFFFWGDTKDKDYPEHQNKTRGNKIKIIITDIKAEIQKDKEKDLSPKDINSEFRDQVFFLNLTAVFSLIFVVIVFIVRGVPLYKNGVDFLPFLRYNILEIIFWVLFLSLFLIAGIKVIHIYNRYTAFKKQLPSQNSP